MKKYSSLGELLSEWREIHGKSQMDLAVDMDTTTRTVGRWETGETLVSTSKEKDLVELLNVPFQVVHNLNSDYPIAIYYDFKLRTYALSLAMSYVKDADDFKSKRPVEDDRIFQLSTEKEIEFVEYVKSLYSDRKHVNMNVILHAAKVLPELNLVLHDQTGYFGGFLCVLPIHRETYMKIRNKEIGEHEITISDFSGLNDPDTIYYGYSIYADSLANAYYILSKLFRYFKIRKKEDELFNYTVAGMAYEQNIIELYRQMGLKVIWQEKRDNERFPFYTFVEGNFDMFLFGKA